AVHIDAERALAGVAIGRRHGGDGGDLVDRVAALFLGRGRVAHVGGARRRRRHHVIGAKDRADQPAIWPVVAAAAALMGVLGWTKRAIGGDSAADVIGIILAAVGRGPGPALHLAVGASGVGRACLVEIIGEIAGFDAASMD